MNTSTRSSDKRNPRSKDKSPELESLLTRFLVWYGDSKSTLIYIGVILSAIFLVYLLIRPPSAADFSDFRLELPSPRGINAPFNFEYVDEISTETKRSQAEAEVPPVYDFHPDRMDQLYNSINQLADASLSTEKNEALTTDDWANQVFQASGLTLENTLYQLSEDANVDMPETTYESLFKYGRDETFWQTLKDQLRNAIGRVGIADTVLPIRKNEQQLASTGIVIIGPDGVERIATALQEIRTHTDVLNRFRELMTLSYPNNANNLAVRQLAIDIFSAAFVGPNLVYNQELTEQRRTAAKQKIDDLVISVSKGETLVGRNVAVTPDHLQKLHAMQNKMRITPVAESGYLLFATIFVLVIIVFLKSYYETIADDSQKIAVLFLSIIMILAITRVVAYLSMMDLGTNTLKYINYAIPVGTLGVIVTILQSARLAVFCCAITSIFAALILHDHINENVLPYLIVLFITSCGAIFTVTRIRQRSDLYCAGGVAMLLAGVVILAVSLQHYSNLDTFVMRADELKWSLIWGGVNGALVSILSIALMPIFEDFYGITTDIKLLELSQKNELLQRLENEAPGTYQHTMRVATLAETAAQAIGANALLTRVGTYYHDIGKMEKPLYFVENQQSSADKARHSKITPNLSCMIIKNHVKKGIEYAKKYNLPKAIVDFIPEHHGTTLMAYFYHQALASEEVEGTVKEDRFRYPGPKPQSKETAIVMLSDALEASSRVLESTTERDIRHLVRKIINERFMDGQFNQCNLTLKDLEVLYQKFSETLIHMMHQRIVYPPAPVKDKEKEDRELINEPSEIIDESLLAEIEPDKIPVAIKEKEKQEPQKVPKRESSGISQNHATSSSNHMIKNQIEPNQQNEQAKPIQKK